MVIRFIRVIRVIRVIKVITCIIVESTQAQYKNLRSLSPPLAVDANPPDIKGYQGQVIRAIRVIRVSKVVGWLLG